MSNPGDKNASVMALCERHRSIGLRQEKIRELISNLEAMLADHHNWFDLTRAQRRKLPAAQPFHGLEDELEQLDHERARLVIDLREHPARSLIEVIAKLEVVARVIEPDDYPEAHALLSHAITDLTMEHG
ncbi:MAG: hypothetical protein GC155_07210 [Alphaproteobacteria bacterium]|nr:hypothetical protein [Alphaproteobacteria bacterium]